MICPPFGSLEQPEARDYTARTRYMNQRKNEKNLPKMLLFTPNQSISQRLYYQWKPENSAKRNELNHLNSHWMSFRITIAPFNICHYLSIKSIVPYYKVDKWKNISRFRFSFNLMQLASHAGIREMLACVASSLQPVAAPLYMLNYWLQTGCRSVN